MRIKEEFRGDPKELLKFLQNGGVITVSSIDDVIALEEMTGLTHFNGAHLLRNDLAFTVNGLRLYRHGLLWTPRCNSLPISDFF